MHYCKGNPSKVYTLSIHLHCLIPPKWVFEWSLFGQKPIKCANLPSVIVLHIIGQGKYVETTTEVFQFSNTERENASSEKEKPWGSMLNFKGVWTTQLKQKRQIGSFPPTWQWTQTCGKKTLGQVLMVYRFQINFLLTGKTIGYPWGIHHDVYMFVKRCHGKKNIWKW